MNYVNIGSGADRTFKEVWKVVHWREKLEIPGQSRLGVEERETLRGRDYGWTHVVRSHPFNNVLEKHSK